MENQDSREEFEAYQPEPVVEAQPVVDNGWLAPAKLTGVAPATVTPSGAPMYDLRPLTLGEVLDRTFSVFRARFWLFAGIAATVAGIQSAAQSLQLVLQRNVFKAADVAHGGAPDFKDMHIGGGVVSLVIAYLLLFLAMGVTQAATAYAVSEVYLGRPATIAGSFRATIRRWLAYIGIAMWQMGSMIWLPLVLTIPAIGLFALRSTGMAVLGGVLLFLGITGGFVGGFILYLRNTLAIPAMVIERLGVRATMKRSKVLTDGAKGRIFVLMLIAGCLAMVVGVLQAPFTMMVAFAMTKGQGSVVGQIGLMLVSFVGQTVVIPVLMIGLTLVYFDQRVRKEAFDIAVMLGEGARAAADDLGA
jgi:hypothetical protein